MDTYARVAKTVEPKKAKLKEATGKLQSSQAMLKEKQAALQEVEERVAGLKRKLDATQAKARELEAQEKECTIKLERASKLIGGLGSEKERWEQLCVTLEEGQRNLVGNMVICSGAIAYQVPFTAAYRTKLNATWVQKVKGGTVLIDDAPTVQLLSDPVEIRGWGINGAADGHAERRERDLRYAVAAVADDDRPAGAGEPVGEGDEQGAQAADHQADAGRLPPRARVEHPRRHPRPPRERAGALDPALDPVLLKQTFKQQGRVMIRLGDTDVDYSDDFGFYITSKLPNPHFPPEVCIKVTVVNFTVTFEGLEDLTAADVAMLERPDLESRKESLVVQIAEGRKQIKDLEDKIIRMLAEARGTFWTTRS